MPLRPVPWATSGGIDGKGGAENSVELARVGAYSATLGATGIIEPGDFRVTALPTPGAAVRVIQGTGVIKSTYPGVFGQSYSVQEQSLTDIPVTATGSSGSAVKFVYVLIQDSQYAGQQPADVKNGPYNSYQVSTSLPLNAPYLLLAKINQPANTATITSTMITDMRKIAVPRRDDFDFARPRVAGDNSPQNQLSAREPGGEYFPGGGGYANPFTVEVPWWATQLKIRANWYGVRYEGNRNTWGSRWMEFGDEYRDRTWPGNQNYEFATQKFTFDSATSGNTYRTDWGLADTRTIPAKLRGKTITFIFKAALATAAQTGTSMDAWSGLSCQGTWLQAPVSDWQGAS